MWNMGNTSLPISSSCSMVSSAGHIGLTTNLDGAGLGVVIYHFGNPFRRARAL